MSDFNQLEKEEILENARQMLKAGEPTEDIAFVTGLSIEEIEKLIEDSNE